MNYNDKRGNLTAVNQGEKLLKQFTFDTANRMSGSAASADGIWKQAVYQYNGLGQRVGQEIFWSKIEKNVSIKRGENDYAIL